MANKATEFLGLEEEEVGSTTSSEPLSEEPVEIPVEVKDTLIEYPISTSPNILGGVELYRVRRTPEQDQASTFSANYVPIDKR